MPIPFFLLAAGLVVVDQIVKYLVRANIPLHHPVEFIPGFDLTYVQNTGAAFSIFSEHTWLLALLSGIVSLVLAGMLARDILPHWFGRLSMALLLGGAVGNLIDRVLFGFVTDMFAATFVRFPVFNVADMGVVAGGVMLCVYVALFMKDEEKEEEP